MWLALALVVAGNGLFKPNIVALVGTLYLPSDPRRANAFCSFYYAVNVGALLGPCVGGVVRASLGWGVTFRIAAVSVVIAATVLVGGKRYLLGTVAAPTSELDAVSFPASAATHDRPGSSRVAALVLVLAILAVFGAALSQSYGTLLLWARDDARRTLFGHAVPPDFFAALPAAFVLLLGPLLERFSKLLAARGLAPSQSGLFTAGMLLCAFAYSLMMAESLWNRGPSLTSPLWLVACKVALAFGELLGVPVGLAFVERLAPPRKKGLTMGLCYLAHALGFWLGGEIGAMWSQWSHARFFGVLALGCIVAATLIQSQARRFSGSLSV